MQAYLKGYYWYKNFGDELLLLGLLSRLWKDWYTQIIIETPDSQWLRTWIHIHQYLHCFPLEKISFTTARNTKKYTSIHKIFGGGEVITDARRFPFNGRNYFLWFFKDIILWNYSLYGGVGTPKKRSTRFLYTYLLWHAKKVVVRDADSLAIATSYGATTELYHDFAYDVLWQFKLDTILPASGKPSPHSGYWLLNLTPYLWNENTKTLLHKTIAEHPDLKWYIFPWEIGVDDVWNDDIFKEFPLIERYDRTQHALEDTLSFVAWASYALATRLHVLLCLHRAGVAYTPLVYQEKIRKMQLA